MFPIGDDDSSRRTAPVVTYALVAVNILFFFVELSGGEPFIEHWSVVPRRLIANPGTDFPSIFTSMFMLQMEAGSLTWPTSVDSLLAQS